MNTNRRSRSLSLVVLTMITTASISQAAPVEPATAHVETAVLAGGCFWGVEAVFEHVKGVRSVVSGYAGGDASSAKYERVGTGRTGHAESVQIVFEPNKIPYGEILDSLNRPTKVVACAAMSRASAAADGRKQVS